MTEKDEDGDVADDNQVIDDMHPTCGRSRIPNRDFELSPGILRPHHKRVTIPQDDERRPIERQRLGASPSIRHRVVGEEGKRGTRFRRGQGEDVGHPYFGRGSNQSLFRHIAQPAPRFLF